MISKNKVNERLRRKTNPELAETIFACKKNEKWLEVGALISRPRRVRKSLNLSEIDKLIKEGETILIPGKVLSQGEINKKAKIIALNFSEGAKEKLKKSKIEFLSIIEEIQKNPKAQGVRILK